MTPTDATLRPQSKGRTTELRHKQERRAERLENISAQVAAGTLQIRQMTAEERDALPAPGERPSRRPQRRIVD